MLSRLGVIGGPALWAAPLIAQSGSVSDNTTVALTARKVASVSVSVEHTAPVRVMTAWAVESARTASLSVVAYVGTPGPAAPGAAAGGAKRSADAKGTAAAVVRLFEQPISPAATVGTRTDDLRVGTDGSPVTINLLVITQ